MRNKKRFVVLFSEGRQKLCTTVYHETLKSGIWETLCGVTIIDQDKKFSRRPSGLRICKRCTKCTR